MCICCIVTHDICTHLPSFSTLYSVVLYLFLLTTIFCPTHTLPPLTQFCPIPWVLCITPCICAFFLVLPACTFCTHLLCFLSPSLHSLPLPIFLTFSSAPFVTGFTAFILPRVPLLTLRRLLRTPFSQAPRTTRYTVATHRCPRATPHALVADATPLPASTRTTVYLLRVPRHLPLLRCCAFCASRTCCSPRRCLHRIYTRYTHAYARTPTPGAHRCAHTHFYFARTHTAHTPHAAQFTLPTSHGFTSHLILTTWFGFSHLFIPLDSHCHTIYIAHCDHAHCHTHTVVHCCSLLHTQCGCAAPHILHGAICIAHNLIIIMCNININNIANNNVLLLFDCY